MATMVYVVIITMTTVGYGDVVPHTTPGRFICMFTALWGAFMVSIMVLMVNNFFELDKNQNEALLHIKTSRAAAKAIIAGFRFLK